MPVNEMIFRKYDIRGVVGRDISERIALKIGRGFGTLMRRTRDAHTLAVGGDVRLSTPSLKESLIEGLLSTGCDVIDAGIVPTPVLYFTICHNNLDGGVIVTASHNPPQDNGFKLCEKNAIPVFNNEITLVHEMIHAGDFETGNGKYSKKEDAIQSYINYLASNIEMGPRKLKIVTDCGNGTGGLAAPQLLKQLGCEVTELYSEPDGNFPNHHPDPTIDEYIKDLIKTVREGEFDIGFGYDGDSDRIGLVDENGRSVSGGFILLMLALDIIEKTPGATICYDVKCSRLLDEVIKEAGGNPVMGATGHAFMKQKMRALNARLGGELSGHIVFNDKYYPYDDAIYVSLRIAELLSRTDRKISDFLPWRDKYVSVPEKRIKCPDNIKFDVVTRVTEKFKSMYRTINIDGVRVEFENGWGLIRASNTQPMLVQRCEADTEENLNKIDKILQDAVEEAKSSIE